MTETCGATHPLYKKLFCCFVAGHTAPHSAPIRRGQWVEWPKPGSAVARHSERATVSAQDRVPRLLYLADDHYGRIGSKSKGRCWYCGVGFSSLKRTMDHVVPRSKGGSNDARNLVFACQPCNTEKASKSLDAYRQHVIRRGGPSVFYGERVGTTGELEMKPKQAMRVIQTLEEAFAFAREGAR